MGKNCGGLTTKIQAIVGTNFQKHWKVVRAATGYAVAGAQGKPWPHDVLRHSFGSYWLAKYQDRARLAEQMGNTVEVIKAHYKRAVPDRIAEAFWALRPEGQSKPA